MKVKRVYPQDGRWYYVRDLEERNPKTGRPKQRWERLTRIDEGEVALHAALVDLLGEKPSKVGNLSALLTEFQGVTFPGLKTGSREEYRRMDKVIAKAFTEYDAADVEPGTVIDFLKNFAAKLNARQKYKARLSSFFAWCCLNSHTGVKVNPCREIKQSGPVKRKGRLNDERFWKLHDALSPMGRCFLELMYYTRQRPTEIRLLRDSHIGPEAFPDYIHFVPTKTEDETALDVHIRITPEVRAVIERARSLRRKKKVVGIKDDAFIIQTRTGDGYSKNGLYEVWRDGIDAAGYTGKNITTRDVRPYSLHKMKQQGHDLDAIQVSAVHSRRDTTEAYLEQHADRLSDARLTLPEKPKWTT